MPPSQYTYRPTASGTFEVYNPDGGRISTGTLDSVQKQYPGIVADPFGEILNTNLAKKKAATTAAATGAGTPTSTSYVSDSSTPVANEKKAVDDLTSYITSGPNVNDLITSSKQSISDIEAYLAALQKRRDQETESINKRYEQERAETEAGQVAERGSTTTTLTTRLGGYLGGSASHVGALTNLAASHRAELAKLASQRDAAVQAAQNAITDKEFAVVRLKAEEIKDLNKEIYKRQQDFFNNAINLQQEARAERESLTEGYKDYLDTLAGAAGSDSEVTLDPARAKEIDDFYGVPGFTANYLDAARKAATAKSDKDRIETFKSYINLLQDIPAGVEVPFGNETITGIGKTADISTYQITDKNTGKQYIAAYNKGSGQLNLTFTGTYGSKETASIPPAQKTALISNATRILSSMPRTDGGKISASAYIAMRQQMLEGGVEDNLPGSLAYIDDYFLGSDSKDVYGQPLGNSFFDKYDIAYLQRELGIGGGYGLLNEGDYVPGEEEQQ